VSTPFLGEIKLVSFGSGDVPNGWASCNGQLLPINQNQALFSLLGTTYGGDGVNTFALPNLQGRTPFHEGSGHTLGETGGEISHTLTLQEMPEHTHIASGSSDPGILISPSNNTWAVTTQNPYSSGAPDSTMTPATISNAGGSQPHNNLQPYLVLHFIIALIGIFPSQN
jgi:microcystin-dependent protein